MFGVRPLGRGGTVDRSATGTGAASGNGAATATETIGGVDPDLEFRPYDRRWEDFPTGTHLTTRGMTVTEAHIVNWANLAGDWLPIHVDHHMAEQTPFGSVIAHGPLTLALALGLVIQTGFFGDSVIAWLGLDEVRLPRPVLPGDTIHAEVSVAEHAATSKPHRGRIALAYDVRNQRDETVLTFSSGFLMHRREPAEVEVS